MTGPDVPSTEFRLGYVPGVTPTKWVRLWNERLPRVRLSLLQVSAAEAADLVRGREADAALLRLPIDRTGLHAIPVYAETTVVVVPKDHVVTAVEEVTAEDLADEPMLHPLDDTLDWQQADWQQAPGRRLDNRPATTADAVELVAAGVGLLVVPQSLARLYHRRDLTYRPVVAAPESQVALSWPEGETTELMEHFIGIVRGRTVNSSRGPAVKKPAEKAAAKGADKPAPRKRRRDSAPPKGNRPKKPRRRS